jgi:hypothetical protein
LGDAGHFHGGRLSLPLGKFGGFFLVGIHAKESFAVAIKNFNLPVSVLSPSVFPEYCGFPASFHLRDTITLNSSSTQFRRRATFT